MKRARAAAAQLQLLPEGPRSRRPQSAEVRALLVLLQQTPTTYSELPRTAQRRCARECEANGLIARQGFDRLHVTEMGRSLLDFMTEHGTSGLQLRHIQESARANHQRDAARARGKEA